MYTRAPARAPGGRGFGTVPVRWLRVCVESAPIVRLGAEGLPVPAEEGRLGERREERRAAAEAYEHTLAVAKVGDRVPVDDHRGPDGNGLVRNLELEPARNHERADVQRVRRDERHGHRVEPAHEDRPSVREVVRGRTGGCG